MARKTILIVDDDKDMSRLLSARLKANSYHTIFATDAYSATNIAKKNNPDLINLDLGLPGGGGGFLVMERLEFLPNPIPIIVLTGGESLKNEEWLFKSGAVAFFQKPPDSDKLLVAIQKALEGVKNDP
jgi:DNA-binding NtrC family response regulator